jgi:hypothetical protein
MIVILKGVIFVAIILFGVNTAKITFKAQNICDKNPIFCQIVKNNQSIDKDYAMKLSNVIYHVAKLYNIDPKKYAAILAQESMYKMGAVNPKSRDYGISQINYRTARVYGFDIQRLTTDVEYAVEAGAIVLADLKKSHGHKEQVYWTRYNSSKPEKREKYKKLVKRFM